MILRIFLLTPLYLSPSKNHHGAILFADAFASNLVDTGIGCMTELSTDEVIMNEEVRPPEQSDFPKMHLAVLDGKDQPIEESTYKYDPTVPSLRIAFVNPYPTKEFNDDLQFVIEVEGKTEDSRDAEFIDGDGSIGCDNNKRVSGRLLESQAAVVLQINDHASRLRVWAGWATGHNAVRLVPDLILEPGEPGAAASAAETTKDLSVEQAEEELEDLEEEIREEEFQNTPKEKTLREQEEDKLQKLLTDDDETTEKPERDPEEEKDLSVEQAEEELEDLEEEIREEEFQNTPKEKTLREQEEDKLQKLLTDDDETTEKPERDPNEEKLLKLIGEDVEVDDTTEKKDEAPKSKRGQNEEKLLELDGDRNSKEERALLDKNEDTPEVVAKPGLQRKRKNALQKPGDAAEEWIDPSKRGNDLGLEIKRKDRTRGRQGGSGDTNKSIEQKLRDKQLDLGAAGRSSSRNRNERKQRHKLADHTVDQNHREIRDIPDTVELYDDGTDDDLPEVDPDEADVRPRAAVRGSKRKPDDSSSSSSFSGSELRVVLETPRHVVACVFFAASIGLFLGVFGRKRVKGRRDL